jgi:hypothetical protein
MKSPSITQIYYIIDRKLKNHNTEKWKLCQAGVGERPKDKISPVAVAIMGERILKRERVRIAKEITGLLNYEMVERLKLTDWKYKKTKLRYKVNGKSYCLLPKSTS